MNWIFTGGRRDSACIPALARDFWAGTDLADTFPRPIEQAVALRLALTIVKVSAVNVDIIRRWLRDRGRTTPLPDDPRDLMGCLVAQHGQGIAFVAGADPADEQRLTIAHEAAHFIADYLRPRQHVIEKLGPEIIPVLDGERPATVFERAAAILGHVRLGPHVHLLPRGGEEVESNLLIEAAEARADALALELVAPRERIIALLASLEDSGSLSLSTRAKRVRVRRSPPADPSEKPESLDALMSPRAEEVVSQNVSAANSDVRRDAQSEAAAALARAFGLPPATFIPLLRAASRPRRSPLLAAARTTLRPHSPFERG